MISMEGQHVGRQRWGPIRVVQPVAGGTTIGWLQVSHCGSPACARPPRQVLIEAWDAERPARAPSWPRVLRLDIAYYVSEAAQPLYGRILCWREIANLWRASAGPMVLAELVIGSLGREAG
jgi:hypothetical protein